MDLYFFWGWVLIATSSIAVLLSLGGIYAVMSFTVSQRTREIGVRVALGSGRARVVGSIFRRPLMQVALGIVIGGAVLAALMTIAVDVVTSRGALMFLAYLVVVALVCSLACIVPTRRALSIEPAEALRSE